MSLQSDAHELFKTLRSVIEALRQFEHPNGSPYAEDMAARLAPLVAEFERAIVSDRSRADAANVLESIAPLLDNVNGAATKGDLEIFPDRNDQTLNRYWDLKTIFRESKYAGQEL